MSLDGIVAARLAETAHFIAISKYYQLASVLILVYDYFLTLDLEIEKVWRRSLQGSTVLFLINRYFPLFCYPVIIYAYHQTNWSSSSCNTFLHFPLAMTVVSDVVISSMVILRLYALYLGQWRVPFALCILAVIQLACGIRAVGGVELIPPQAGVNGCIITVKLNSTDRFALLWSISVIFDFAAFLLTLWQTLSLRPKTGKGIQTRLYDLLLRDGVVYFAVMFTAKLINFIVFWTISRDLITINWTFNHTITAIMISRLFLNLRAEPMTIDATGLGSSTFRSLWGNVVGNLGSRLDSDMEFALQASSKSPAYPLSPGGKMAGIMESYMENGLSKWQERGINK